MLNNVFLKNQQVRFYQNLFYLDELVKNTFVRVNQNNINIFLFYYEKTTIEYVLKKTLLTYLVKTPAINQRNLVAAMTMALNLLVYLNLTLC